MQEQQKDGKNINDKQPLTWTQPHTKSAAEQGVKQPGMARTIGIFAAGLVVGVLIGWGYSTSVDRGMAGANATSTPSTRQSSSTGGLTIGADGNAESSFSVADPQPAGLKVSITKAVVSKPTWVVVYEDNDGKTGRALGATLFTAQKQSGTVTLLRGTVAGNDYLVGQSVDDGNKTFSLKADKPVLVGDNPLLVGFTAE